MSSHLPSDIKWYPEAEKKNFGIWDYKSHNKKMPCFCEKNSSKFRNFQKNRNDFLVKSIDDPPSIYKVQYGTIKHDTPRFKRRLRFTNEWPPRLRVPPYLPHLQHGLGSHPPNVPRLRRHRLTLVDQLHGTSWNNEQASQQQKNGKNPTFK